MRIYPLFSSSKGNSIYIGDRTQGILIDCGVSFKRLRQALDICEIPLSAVKAVFITHEHSDHVKGLKGLTKATGIPVYSHPLTLDELYDNDMICSQAMEIKDAAELCSMRISCFDTSHDAVSPCGYRIECGSSACAVCTDLGTVTNEVLTGIMGVSAIVLEANYDEYMLRTGPYPFETKQRISCGIGHLSNDQCAELAEKLVRNGTNDIILGHLSQNNNTPAIASAAVSAALEREGFTAGRDYMLSCAPAECTEAVYVTF